MTRGGAGPGQLCWSLMHCLMSVRGGQWAHHGPGHQQSPGGEWSLVYVSLCQYSASIRTFLLWGGGFASVSIPSPLSGLFPIIWSILLVKLHRRVDTIYPVTAYTLASVYDEIFAPLTCCQWLPVVMWVTWQCQWLRRTPAEAVWTPRSLIEVTLGGSREHRQPPLAELMKCLPLLDEISHERTTNGTTLRAGTHDFLGKQIILRKS